MSALTHVLYRAFDERGDLLYVGVTGNIKTRMQAHKSASPWHSLVADLKVSHPMSHYDAMRAEVKAISAEAPVYNKLRRNGSVSPEELYLRSLPESERIALTLAYEERMLAGRRAA